MNRPIVAVVVAAGSGTRLGGGQPKALREIAGEALVSHSLRAMAAGGVQQAVVLIPAGAANSYDLALATMKLPFRCARILQDHRTCRPGAGRAPAGQPN